MRRVKNLIENKGLINTFKKLKTKVHLNKKNFKQISFYFSKYNNYTPWKKKFLKNYPILKNVFCKKYNPLKKIFNLDFSTKGFSKFGIILMFM